MTAQGQPERQALAQWMEGGHLHLHLSLHPVGRCKSSRTVLPQPLFYVTAVGFSKSTCDTCRASTAGSLRENQEIRVLETTPSLSDHKQDILSTSFKYIDTSLDSIIFKHFF